MKRNKKILILCGILVCVSLAAFGVNRYEKEKERIKNSDEMIMEIDSEQVTLLSWECDTGSFAFHRDENGNWIYDEDGEFPVDGEKIKGLLAQFEQFGVSFMIEEVEDFGQYGLDEPVCTVRMETASESYEILLGNYSAMDSERYVSIGDGNVYLVKTDPLDRFSVEISDLIRHDEIPAFADVTQMRFSGADSEQIVYEEESGATYSSEDIYFVKREETLLPLDTYRVRAYLDVIGNMNLRDYVNYKASEGDLAACGLDTPELSVMIDYVKTEEDTNGEGEETFVLHIGRDPAEREAEHGENTEDDNGEPVYEEENDGEAGEEEVTAYARVGESKIIYRLTTEQYRELKEMTYDSLRHQELFWADFSDVYQIDIGLEGQNYTITSELKNDNRIWYYQEEELDTADLRSAIRGLRAVSFTDRTPDRKEEISLTFSLDHENFPEVRVQLYRYDGDTCIAVVDGKTEAFVERAAVVDLMEAVNGIVLK